MTAPDCGSCPPPCRRTDCPHADREWRPGTVQDELHEAWERWDEGGE